MHVVPQKSRETCKQKLANIIHKHRIGKHDKNLRKGDQHAGIKNLSKDKKKNNHIYIILFYSSPSKEVMIISRYCIFSKIVGAVTSIKTASSYSIHSVIL